ncbi:MAG: hypothetical protein VR77_05080 [Flavobacteriales bacterium BRH_c54]|nr:MAG: hypothetical protein VR77_05080 [Flavobacteriales bacterium BRH_c54]
MRNLTTIIFLFIIISFFESCYQEKKSVSSVLLNALKSNEQIDFQELNGLLANENSPYIVISDSIIENTHSWLIRSINNQENVYRDLGALSICINDTSSFSYKNEKYLYSEFDSIAESYLEEINNQKGEAIFQLFILKSELDKHEWEDVLKCVKLFHSKTNPSYSVIGFNQKCSKVVIPLPQEELEEIITE